MICGLTASMLASWAATFQSNSFLYFLLRGILSSLAHHFIQTSHLSGEIRLSQANKLANG